MSPPHCWHVTLRGLNPKQMDSLGSPLLGSPLRLCPSNPLVPSTMSAIFLAFQLTLRHWQTAPWGEAIPNAGPVSVGFLPLLVFSSIISHCIVSSKLSVSISPDFLFVFSKKKLILASESFAQERSPCLIFLKPILTKHALSQTHRFHGNFVKMLGNGDVIYLAFGVHNPYGTFGKKLFQSIKFTILFSEKMLNITNTTFFA